MQIIANLNSPKDAVAYTHFPVTAHIPNKRRNPLILRSNPAPKSSETKCDINHISRLGHIWESDMIIWNGGGSERQSSDGRRVASFDLTALIFQWPKTCLIRCGTERSGPGCLLSWGSAVWQQDQELLCRWRWKKANTHGGFFAEGVWSRMVFVILDSSDVCYSRLIQHRLLLSGKILTSWTSRWLRHTLWKSDIQGDCFWHKIPSFTTLATS